MDFWNDDIKNSVIAGAIILALERTFDYIKGRVKNAINPSQEETVHQPSKKFKLLNLDEVFAYQVSIAAPPPQREPGYVLRELSMLIAGTVDSDLFKQAAFVAEKHSKGLSDIATMALASTEVSKCATLGESLRKATEPLLKLLAQQEFYFANNPAIQAVQKQMDLYQRALPPNLPLCPFKKKSNFSKSVYL